MFLNNLWGYLAALGGVVVAILAALGIAKRAGRKEEQAVETERALKEAKESNEIIAKNRSLSDADARAKLRGDQRD